MNQMHPQAQAVSLPWQVIDKVAFLLLLLARTYLFEKTLTVKSKNRRMYVDYALDSHHILLIQGVETTSAVTKLGSRDPARQKQQARTIDTNSDTGEMEQQKPRHHSADQGQANTKKAEHHGQPE